MQIRIASLLAAAWLSLAPSSARADDPPPAQAVVTPPAKGPSQVVVTPPATKPSQVVVTPPARGPSRAAPVQRPNSARERVVSDVVVTPPAPRTAPEPARQERRPARAQDDMALAPVRLEAASAISQGTRDHALAAASRELTPVAALVGFTLQYPGSRDHKLRRFGVLARDGEVELSLADRGSSGPFEGRAQYMVLDRGAVGEVTAYGGGAFEIPLPTPPRPGSTLVLRGFEFQRDAGTDANLRQVGVWLDGERNVARVSLVDDQGADFRGFDEVLMNAFLAGNLPFGILAGTTASIADGVDRLEAAGGPHRAYAVTVQYAWVPDDAAGAQGRLSGSRERAVSGRRPTSVAALQGFDFTFGNGDHHLGAIAVSPRTATPATFRDSNLDDPMQWRIGYVELATGGADAGPVRVDASRRR